MNGSDTRVTASQLVALRGWERRNLYFCDTLVSYDVMLLIISADEQSFDINVKAINALLPYSPSYIRQILRDLQQQEFTSIERDTRDKRNTFIKPTEKLRTAFKDYRNVFLKTVVNTAEPYPFDIASELSGKF